MRLARLCWLGSLAWALVHCDSEQRPPRAVDLSLTPSGGSAGGSNPASTASTPDASAQGLSTPDASAPAPIADAGSATLYPADWCSRLGESTLPATIRISNAFNTAVYNDCRLSRLTASLDNPQYSAWRNYLQDYAFVMAGCIPDFAPPPGGIRVFGPANTPAVGGVRGPLTPAEAMLLANAYVEAFGAELKLSAAEKDALRAYLLDKAQADIDINAVASLSACVASVADAGADAASP